MQHRNCFTLHEKFFPACDFKQNCLSYKTRIVICDTTELGRMPFLICCKRVDGLLNPLNEAMSDECSNGFFIFKSLAPENKLVEYRKIDGSQIGDAPKSCIWILNDDVGASKSSNKFCATILRFT